MTDTPRRYEDRAACAGGVPYVVRGHDSLSREWGYDTIGLRCTVFRLRDPSVWKWTEETDGSTGEVEDGGVRPLVWEKGFRCGVSKKNGRHLWCRFDAGWGFATNSELLWARPSCDVLSRLSERFAALGIEADIETMLLTRVDFAADIRVGESVRGVNEHIKAVGDRIHFGHHFEQALDLPHSKRWWTGTARPEEGHPRVVRLYNRMLKGGDPTDPVARLEVAWHGVREVERALQVVTLGELAAQPEVGREAFIRLIEPVLPEPAPVVSDVDFDFDGLCGALEYDTFQIGLALRWKHLHEAGDRRGHLDLIGAAKSAKAKCALKKQLERIEPFARAYLTPNRGRDQYATMRRLLLSGDLHPIPLAA